MFGKGIVRRILIPQAKLLQYLANMASKSANYCALGMSGGEGLLLLCEAQLGNPLYQCKSADGSAAKNCAAAVSNPSFNVSSS
jgi:Poly(ADP-ribose) polymerase catalytic domain